MAYIDKATMLDACNADTGDAPGMNTNCKFIAPGEDISTEVSNRPHLQLAENCDVLKAVQDPLVVDVSDLDTAMDDEKAYPEILSFTTGGASNTLVITTPNLPVYVGGSGYTDTQEFRDILIQLTDTEGNEVVIGGFEVKCASIKRDDTAVDIIGQGFWDSTDVRITFSGTLEAATDYRLVFARKTTLRTLPEDGLIAANIRGAHEAPAEAAYKSMIVCAPDTTRGAADYVGVNALRDAIDAAGTGKGSVIFVRYGTYTMEGSGGGDLTISESNLTIIGEGSDSTNGVTLEIDTTSGDEIYLSGFNNHFYNVRFLGTGSEGKEMTVYSHLNTFHKCRFDNFGIFFNTSSSTQNGMFNCTMDNMDAKALDISGASYLTFTDCMFKGNCDVTAESMVHIRGNSNNITFNSCRVWTTTTGTENRDALILDGCYNVTFDACSVQASFGRALMYDGGTNLSAASFNNCRLSNGPSGLIAGSKHGPIMPETVDVAQNVQLSFTNCYVYTTPVAWYEGPFVQLLAKNVSIFGGETADPAHGFIRLNNCRFSDRYCKGTDTTTNPPSTTTGTTPFPVMEFRNVTGDGVIFDRDGLTYDIQDSSWVECWFCDISNFRIVYPDVSTNGCFEIDSTAAPHPHLAEFIASTVRNLSIIGWVGSGSTTANREWKRGILNVRGWGESATTGQAYSALVDGFDIYQLEDPGAGATPFDWEISSSYLVTTYQATIQNFRWNSDDTKDHRNKLDGTVALGRLINVGLNSEIVDADILHDVAGGLLDEIFGSSTNDGRAVKNCRIELDDPGNAAVGMANVVNDIGIMAQVSDNTIVITTSDVSGAVIDQQSKCRVTDNYIKTVKTTAYNVIDITDANAVVSGNVLVGGGSGTAPDINPNTVIGYANNLRVVS